jgi:hypothetical protein
MPVPERPQLRPYLAAQADDDARYMLVWDRLGLNRMPQRLTRLEFLCLKLCDGQRTLRDIQAEAMHLTDHQFLTIETLLSFLERMERALFLDGPGFRERVDGPIRFPVCLGSYEADPHALRDQLRQFFTATGGPGLPRYSHTTRQLRAALVPHIDYGRGGTTYAWGFKEIAERSEASLFIIIGTSHLSSHRFTLTRKAFQTPLGITPTDQDYIDRLVHDYGADLFTDEWQAHLPEWSIELEVVFLQYLYEGKRPIRIVPLVVGPFQDSIATNDLPSAQEDIARMVEALRRTEEGTREAICYLISGDLAHIGPKFGDRGPLSDLVLASSWARDQAILQQVEAVDSDGYFRVIAEEKDARRICGLPPTYLTLQAARPRRGKVLHYDQYRHPRGHESVSFASVAFYR